LMGETWKGRLDYAAAQHLHHNVIITLFVRL
jgi:hypothetical protein